MNEPKVTQRLLSEAVVLRHEESRSSNEGSSESLDQQPTSQPRGALPRGGIDLQLPGAITTTRRVEQFLYHQAELLDGKHWAAYINLFADLGIYWIPVSRDQSEWLDTPSLLIEDKSMMRVRMDRVMHPRAWSQAPMWGTHHLVGNTVIEAETAEAITVRSRFQMIELRRDEMRHFAGTYSHELLKVDDGFRIRLQRVDLLNGQSVFDYVLQVWV